MLLPRARPEDHGVDPAAIAAFIDALGQTGGVHGAVVVRDGAVIAEGWWEPYGPELRHSMYSVSKSFTSVAIGLAVAEGRLSIDDRVIDLLPEDAPAEASGRLASLRVRHLLTMTTGHAVDTVDSLHLAADGGWARAILATELPHEPGKVFVYNSGATYLLSAIITRLTGAGLLEYLGPRLLVPLGIEGATWQQSPEGIATGGWGLSITTEQLAVFAEFCRLEGLWAGARLVPVEWMRAATAFQVPTDDPDRDEKAPDWREGYGYQFWRSRHGYRADGAFGQFAVVLPEQGMVVALTSGLPDGAPLLDLIWEHLLPGAAVAPVTPKALALPLPLGAAHAEPAQRTLSFPPQATGALRRFALDGSPLDLVNLAGTHRIPVGHGRWLAGEVAHQGVRVPVAAAGAWVDAATWVAQIWLVETPFRATLTLTDDGADVRLDATLNVSFGPVEFAALQGGLSSGIVERAGSGADWTLTVQITEAGAVTLELAEG
ncbi:MAG: beta-lactamase [Rhodoglobus sp.]|nr:beta-lactamase [Rhodoglobus sp.]